VLQKKKKKNQKSKIKKKKKKNLWLLSHHNVIATPKRPNGGRLGHPPTSPGVVETTIIWPFVGGQTTPWVVDGSSS
jgi:hypothetical protein